MGIKKKIRLGFISISVLLLLSGVISTIELAHFKTTTQGLLNDNRMNVEFSKGLLDAAQGQNSALLMNIAGNNYTTHDSVVIKNMELFQSMLVDAGDRFAGSVKFDILKKAHEDYQQVTSAITDTTSIEWFSEVYQTSYYNLTNTIKDFMVDAQELAIAETISLERGAHRATMLGIIALAAGLLLVLLFYFMLNRFMLSPILKIQKSLTDYLDLRKPFKVPLTAKDEIMKLRDDITRLIEKTKK